MNIENMIDKYGTIIADNLKIAVSEVYPKILMYVRMNGVLTLIDWLIFFVIFVIGMKICLKFASKLSTGEEDKVDKFSIYVFVFGVALLILIPTIAVFTPEITMSVVKIISPEYYIIDQIVKQAVK